jgi:uncharacterized membrane protein
MTAESPHRRAASRGRDPTERRPRVFRALFVTVSLLLATLAGIITALILETAFGLPFRPTWVLASLILFVVPAVIVYQRAQRREP